jgi:hypothetical protein
VGGRGKNTVITGGIRAREFAFCVFTAAAMPSRTVHRLYYTILYSSITLYSKVGWVGWSVGRLLVGVYLYVYNMYAFPVKPLRM